MNSLSEIRKNIGAFFYQESIGNKVDRNGNQFLSFFYLSEEDYAERLLASIKYVDNFNGCSFIPNKKKGDEFSQKYLSIKNIIIYEDEARETPCALYCFGMVANGKVFYKIGITVTRHSPDKSDIGLINQRINQTEGNFYNAKNGILKIYPLFIVKSNLYNCFMLENAIHRNPVFDGSIAREFNYFSGVNECCNYLDWKHMEKLIIEAEKSNEYVLEKSIYLKKVDIDEHKRIVSDFHRLNYGKYLQNWSYLATLDQQIYN